jgi:hypothetical protein
MAATDPEAAIALRPNRQTLGHWPETALDEVSQTRTEKFARACNLPATHASAARFSGQASS